MPHYDLPVFAGNAPQFCRIESGHIAEGPRQFPNGGDLEALANAGDLAQLQMRGWLPHVLYDPGGECLTHSTFEVLANEVAEIKHYRDYTAEERAAIAAAQAEFEARQAERLASGGPGGG